MLKIYYLLHEAPAQENTVALGGEFTGNLHVLITRIKSPFPIDKYQLTKNRFLVNYFDAKHQFDVINLNIVRYFYEKVNVDF